MRATGPQSDLFDPQPDLFDHDSGIEPPPPDYIQEIREELLATLDRVRVAQGLPWRNLTQTTLAELRFHALAKSWLPEEEAWRLRRAFNKEMLRIYEIIQDVPLFPDL